MILAVTGHRPDKLGGYDEDTHERLSEFAAERLVELNPSMVITGMALGWDTAVATACVDLRLPFLAAVPFIGQESKWSGAAKVRYYDLCNRATDVEIVCEGPYMPWKMMRRNKWMVDRCDLLLALHNGDTFGGTFECVMYARRREIQVHNAWEGWIHGQVRREGEKTRARGHEARGRRGDGPGDIHPRKGGR
jgi:uncharacterized phage-like protein YoqJ